jgi:hypothetical protein
VPVVENHIAENASCHVQSIELSNDRHSRDHVSMVLTERHPSADRSGRDKMYSSHLGNVFLISLNVFADAKPVLIRIRYPTGLLNEVLEVGLANALSA